MRPCSSGFQRRHAYAQRGGNNGRLGRLLNRTVSVRSVIADRSPAGTRRGQEGDASAEWRRRQRVLANGETSGRRRADGWGKVEGNGRAGELMRAGKYEEALRVVVRALDRYPDDPKLLTTAGVVQSRLGQTQKARRALLRACSVDGTDSYPFVALAAVESRAGDLERASAVLEEGAAMFPRDAKVLNARAQLARKRGARTHKVVGMLQEADDACTEQNTALQLTLARIDKERGKLHDARERLLRALQSDRGHAECWLELGLLEARTKGLRRGRDVLRDAVREGMGISQHAPLLAAWARLEDRLGNRRSAMWLMSNARGRRHFNVRTLTQWALIVGKGDTDWELSAARRILEEAVAMSPADTYSRHALAMHCRRLGDAEAAERLLRENVEIDPRSVISWFGLGLLLTSKGELEAAETAFLSGTGRRSVAELLRERIDDGGESVRRPAPRDLTAKHAKCIDQLALLAKGRHDVEVTRSLHALAHRLDGGEASIAYHWALFEKNQGNTRIAAELFSVCAELSPSKPLTYLNWGLMERRNGDYDAAIRLFERGTAARPSCAPIWISWSVTESKRGALDEARRVLDRGLAHCSNELQMWVELAIVTLRLAGPRDAMMVLERAVEAVPGFRVERDYLEAKSVVEQQLALHSREERALDGNELRTQRAGDTDRDRVV